MENVNEDPSTGMGTADDIDDRDAYSDCANPSGLRSRMSSSLRTYIDELQEWNRQALEVQAHYSSLTRDLLVQEQARYQQYYEEQRRLHSRQLHGSRENRANRAGQDYTDFKIPPLWKRLVAEVIDFAFIFTIKLLVTFLLLDALQVGSKIRELDLMKLVDQPTMAVKMTFDVALFELLFRAIVCLYEMYWTHTTGGTPGKRIMGLRVVYVETVTLIPPPNGGLLPQPPAAADANRNGGAPAPLDALAVANWVRAHPGTLLGWRTALLRALIKNLFVGMLMTPLCFSFLFVQYHNRTGYDVLAKSLVVEARPEPRVGPRPRPPFFN